MESAFGALGSPDEVFAKRYQDFFENLMPESSSLSFAILAAYVDRLTPEMFRTIQQKLQTKLVDASRLETSEGIVFFAWSVLKKQPKILAYNHAAYRLITIKAIEAAFVQRFVTNESEDDSIFEVPFALYSTLYANDWKLIPATITVVAKKKPPYKQEGILDLSILNEYGNEKKRDMVYFLWSLLENVIVNSQKGFKINVEYILKVVETTISLRQRELTEKAFGTLITIARGLQTNFAIYIDRIFMILNASTIPSTIVYKFLINLLEELGPLADISKLYNSAVFKLTNIMAKEDKSDASEGIEIVGRHGNLESHLASLHDDSDDVEEDLDLLFDLVICILETIPTFISLIYLSKIQSAVCKRLLRCSSPTANDLRILNALMTIRNEELASPVQIARYVYAQATVFKTPELLPYIKIGKALCDTQKGVRNNAFTAFQVEADAGIKDSVSNDAKLKPIEVDVEDSRPIEADAEDFEPIEVDAKDSETIDADGKSNDAGAKNSKSNDIAAKKKSNAQQIADDDEDEIEIIFEGPSSVQKENKKSKGSQEKPRKRKAEVADHQTPKKQLTVPEMLQDMFTS